MANRPIIYPVPAVAPTSPAGLTKLCSVCPGELIGAKIFGVVGAGKVAVDPSGNLPHLLYKPVFSGWDHKRGTIGGNAGNVPGDDYLQFRVDLSRLLAPFAGEVLIDGGLLADPAVPLSYEISFSRSDGRRADPGEHTLSKYGSGNALGLPVPIPQGATYVWVPVATAVTMVTWDGQQFPLTLQPGERYPVGMFTTILGAATFPALYFAIIF